MILPHSLLAGCTFLRIHSLKGELNFQVTVGFLQLHWLVPVILAKSVTGRNRQGRLLWVQYYSADSCPHFWSREKSHHSYSHRKWGISQRLTMKGLMGNAPIHHGPEVLISSCGCNSTLFWGTLRPTLISASATGPIGQHSLLCVGPWSGLLCVPIQVFTQPFQDGTSLPLLL